MSKKHFKALAAIVAKMRLDDCARMEVAARLADFCVEQNPRFDRARFIEACGFYRAADRLQGGEAAAR